MKLKWRFGVIAGIFLAVFCLYPQFKMLYLRGAEWNGHYAYNDIDEVAYAAYVRALIDGRPRKNDPYSGRDERPETPQPESLFSIQFAAPYTIALPARLLGIGAPWAMTLAGALAGFLAALAAFWLIARFTGSNWYGMSGSLVVFAGGALAAGEGALPEIALDGFSYPYFPGFRRYIPALATTAVFALFCFVWKLLGDQQSAVSGQSGAEKGHGKHGSKAEQEQEQNEVQEQEKEQKAPVATASGSDLIYVLAAIAAFAYTVFSYFYTWTTAAAWLGCLGVLWVAFRPAGSRRDLKLLAGLAAGCVLSLVPYAYLLSRRSETMDDVQLLVHTRSPDIWRVPEFISVVCLFMLAAALINRHVELRERSTLFVFSLVLVPLVVFNQQVLTGRSLQPIHYQVFIGNYVAGLALVLTIGLLLRRQLAEGKWPARAACAMLAAAAVAWGFVECHYTVRVLDGANIERDLALPVARRLEELAKSEPNPHRMTVLAYDMIQADDLPTVAPHSVLWARHQHVFAGMSWQENKERYYQYLYYSGVDEKGLDYLLKNDFVSQIALFGWGRHTDRLSFDAKALTYGEIAEEVDRYASYRENFRITEAASPLLSYVIVNEDADTDLSTLDTWYERYSPETIGKYTLYRVRLRPE